MIGKIGAAHKYRDCSQVILVSAETDTVLVTCLVGLLPCLPRTSAAPHTKMLHLTDSCYMLLIC
jgi:hypothetical protein